ncbi:hypothetical protein EVG20_g3484 [Dentipellis fragilis]|uniref:BTB domain-containing protein n=1 Tax=Dentipellis fragilis TaxID=205917 RepID=A0A4Y9Z3L6_9AGAM|nr:hypothetical protein EVG20_g3484 [Dentipellis fragilis]
MDASKIIVTLETSTASHKTTLSTLTSRPSHLADYLKSLFRRNSDASSVYSRTSEYCDSPDTSFNSIFHHHLESSGLLPQSSTHMHIFLDRASASYEHILAFLRSPPSTIDYTTTLPHAIQLHTYSTARIEALVALRDEARYLGLDDLHKLCVEELRTRQPRTHTRGADSMSSTGSIRSTHTMRDRDSGERTLVSSERDGHGRDSLGSGSGSTKSARSRSSDVASLGPLSSPSPSLQQKLADRGRKDAQGVFSLRSRGTANWL